MNLDYLFRHPERVASLTLEHLVLSGTAMLLAIVVAIPLGVAAARWQRLTLPILGTLGVVYTIPSLAFLAFLIPSLGIGRTPALVVLVAYAQLFLVRNLVAGLRGVDRATLPGGVAAALREAAAIVLCPSNPIVSLGPILAVPGFRDLIREAPGAKVAVSPIVGGRALKGPADQMLASLGHDVSPLGVARLYRDFLDGFVLDREDAAAVPAIEALGLPVLVTQTIMGDAGDRRRLAEEVLAFAGTLKGR